MGTHVGRPTMSCDHSKQPSPAEQSLCAGHRGAEGRALRSPPVAQWGSPGTRTQCRQENGAMLTPGYTAESEGSGTPWEGGGLSQGRGCQLLLHTCTLWPIRSPQMLPQWTCTDDFPLGSPAATHPPPRLTFWDRPCGKFLFQLQLLLSRSCHQQCEGGVLLQLYQQWAPIL